jgi:chorismate mutase/prephenate dehydratase
LGVPGAKLTDVKEVYSHQQGFLQCSDFLAKYPEWLKITYINTAVSAKMVAEAGDKTLAAISSRRAGDMYGLEVLAAEINGQKHNCTRFVIFSKHLEMQSEANKVSVMFTLPHKSGTLYHAIKNLADRGINMLKIESRPAREKNWEYVFFIDFEGNLKETRSLKALNELKKESGYFRLLGNYKADISKLQDKEY